MHIVYKHENKAIVYSARNLLELEGIETVIKNEHSASAAGNLGMSLSAAELWIVDSGDLDKAKLILYKMDIDTPDGPDWKCNKCHEENEGNFQICWKCQSEKSNS